VFFGNIWKNHNHFYIFTTQWRSRWSFDVSGGRPCVCYFELSLPIVIRRPYYEEAEAEMVSSRVKEDAYLSNDPL
jgi:hypothetical protein